MHRVYLKEGIEGIAARCAANNALVIDVKGCLNIDEALKFGVAYWRL
jgi:hypothetical protein